MRLLLHAVATTDAAAVPQTGLRGQPLAIVQHAELSAYASCLDAASEPFRRADLLEHHDLISALASQAEGLLPARFPTWFADRDALRRELERRHDDLVAGLARVRGRVELAVTAVWTTAELEVGVPPEALTPGRKYLLERQREFGASERRRARARELADDLERRLANDLVEVRHEICPSPTVAVSSAVLVARIHAEKIKARLIRAEQDVRILVNGPWPAYTFVNVV